jgi:hypothetical protein
MGPTCLRRKLTGLLLRLQGRDPYAYAEQGRDRPDWNIYLDQVTDARLQELGLTREQLELTRFCEGKAGSPRPQRNLDLQAQL